MYNHFLQNTTHGPILYSTFALLPSEAFSHTMRPNLPDLETTKIQLFRYQPTVGKLALKLKLS